MVPDSDQVTGHNAARHQGSDGGRDKKLFAAKEPQCVDGHTKRFRVDAFVQVDATLKASHIQPIQLAEDQPAVVTRHGRDGEIGDVVVRDNGLRQ